MISICIKAKTAEVFLANFGFQHLMDGTREVLESDFVTAIVRGVAGVGGPSSSRRLN